MTNNDLAPEVNSAEGENPVVHSLLRVAGSPDPWISVLFCLIRQCPLFSSLSPKLNVQPHLPLLGRAAQHGTPAQGTEKRAWAHRVPRGSPYPFALRSDRAGRCHSAQGDGPAVVLTRRAQSHRMELSSPAPGQPPRCPRPEAHSGSPSRGRGSLARCECGESQSSLLSHPFDFCLMSK